MTHITVTIETDGYTDEETQLSVDAAAAYLRNNGYTRDNGYTWTIEPRLGRGLNVEIEWDLDDKNVDDGLAGYLYSAIGDAIGDAYTAE